MLYVYFGIIPTFYIHSELLQLDFGWGKREKEEMNILFIIWFSLYVLN